MPLCKCLPLLKALILHLKNWVEEWWQAQSVEHVILGIVNSSHTLGVEIT